MAAFPPAPLRVLVDEVGTILLSSHETVSVAETAAGGLISASLLSFPGASGFYKGGLTLYTLPSRIAYGGWTEETIKGYKGPTPDVVKGLAENVRAKLESTYTICESGTAGPTGGQARNRIPGYVALAIAAPRDTYTREVETGLGTGREANMVAFAAEALKLLLDVIKGDAKL